MLFSSCKGIILYLKLVTIMLLFLLIISCSSQSKKPKDTVEQNVENINKIEDNSSNQIPLSNEATREDNPINIKVGETKAEPKKVDNEIVTQKVVENTEQSELKTEMRGKEEYISLQYRDADITSVIATMAEKLKINYVLAPNIKGKVTIQSKGNFPAKDLFQIFSTMLELNALAIIKDGEVYRIIELDVAKQNSLEVSSGKSLKNSDNAFMTQIIPIEFAKASDIASRIKPILARGTEIIVYEPSNMIIISGAPTTISKFIKIVETLDSSSSDNDNIRVFVYNVENGDAKNLANILKDVYSKGDGGKSGKSSGAESSKNVGMPSPASAEQGSSNTFSGEVGIIPYEDINALVIKCTSANYLTVMNTIKQLDVKIKQVLIEVLILEVTLSNNTQFGVEWLLRSALNKNLTMLSGVSPQQPSYSANLFPAPVVTTSTPAATTSTTTTTTATTPTTSTTTVPNILSFVPPVGTAFSALIAPNDIGVLLSMVASKGNLSVHATPHILALDNKEAKIEIGDEIPVATGFSQSPSAAPAAASAPSSASSLATSLVSAGQIQYKTVGILLTVTPHITDQNMVRLKIAQEISSRGVDVSLAGITSPSFSKRKAETVGIVKNGHTLLIGGLISEQKNTTRRGIPILMDIPILGYFFGTTVNETKKTELLVMVTPHVIGSSEEADAIVEDFKSRVSTIKVRLEKDKKTQ